MSSKSFGLYCFSALCAILAIFSTDKGCSALNMRNSAQNAETMFIVTADGEDESIPIPSSASDGESETLMRIRTHDPTYQSSLKPQLHVQESTRADSGQPKVEMNPRSNAGFIQSSGSGNPFRNQERQAVGAPSQAVHVEDSDDDGDLDWDSLYRGQLKRAVRLVHNTQNTEDLSPRRIVRVHSINDRESQNNVEGGRISEPLDMPIIGENLVTSDPPPHEQVAKMARYIVKNSNWTSMATISSRNPIVGFPFANIFSISDGPLNGNSTGVPYMYLTPLEISVQDLEVDSRASLTMSLAQGSYCRIHSYDPEDPRCAHVILTGNVVEVLNSTSEVDFARDALFSRHPEMPDWPKDHGWFFAKLNISSILVLDYFGGAKSVSLEDYFTAN